MGEQRLAVETKGTFMKISLKGFLAFLVLFSGWARMAQAGQQVYLSTSPNERYRVFVEQVIDRRVGDRVFFRYPVMLVNVRRPDHHFEIMEVGSPLIQETERGTFKLHWGGNDPAQPTSIHFDWAKDSLKFFIHVEVLEGNWRTYFVDVNTGKALDITADLEQPLVAKFEARDWDCQAPRTSLVKWVKPHLAFFKLDSICGKDKKKINEDLFHWSESILFDTNQGKAVMGCDNSYTEETATQKFEQYYLSTIPTPTPTPEETPVAQ
jgi:hypothetical protein